jgi:hypothetical protein
MINDLLIGAYNRSPMGNITGATGYTPTDVLSTAKDTVSASGSLALVGSTIGAFHLSGLFKGGLEGLHYSVGGERVFGTRMGSVMSTMSATDLSRTISMGEKYLKYSSDVFSPLNTKMTNSIDDVFAIGARQSNRPFLQQFGKANLLFPIGASILGGIDAYSTEGMTGLGNFMIQDVFANKYGMQASTEVFDISGANNSQRAAIADRFGDDRLKDNKYKSIQDARSGALLKSPAIFRMQSILGGYAGASIGMEAGRTAGEMAASYMNWNETKQGILGFAGSVFGAAGGAKVGAYMGGSFLRLGLMGAGLGAVSIMKSYMQDALGSGGTIKHRGLNYAGDVAAFQTQMASTMRQRSLQAMHKSHLNARSAFGQEASMVHMNRDMFGQYRR